MAMTTKTEAEKRHEVMMGILERLYNSGQRVILHYGDTETGRDYDEVHDIEGYVRKSTGTKPIYILVNNHRAFGGGAILVDSIVKIETSRGRVELFKNSKYHRVPYCAYCGIQKHEHRNECTKSGTPKYDINNGWSLDIAHKKRHPK